MGVLIIDSTGRSQVIHSIHSVDYNIHVINVFVKIAVVLS